MSAQTEQTFLVGGLEANVYSRSSQTPGPAVVMFVLHGRHGNCKDPATTSIVNGLLQNNAKQSRNLYVVTFDQRNHGHRLVNETANKGWSKSPDRHNDRHATDMYSMQVGTARDVSFLIDFLPSYLFPSGEQVIETWAVAGVSLGGHATWLALTHEPRLSIGIPVIGCPDYLSLISERALKFDIPLDGSAYLPDSLLSLIQSSDPAAAPYRSIDASNPFLGKKILVLSGGKDTLVPWSASESFVEHLNVGDKGVKQAVVQEDAGHETTPEMVQRLVDFITEHALKK
ncbi:Alpha/Beta hydrolase protein [Mucidula mucida]|nr:Alpha/Beta hydrolase protein [Mucidula mucida]